MTITYSNFSPLLSMERRRHHRRHQEERHYVEQRSQPHHHQVEASPRHSPAYTSHTTCQTQPRRHKRRRHHRESLSSKRVSRYSSLAVVLCTLYSPPLSCIEAYWLSMTNIFWSFLTQSSHSHARKY